MARRPRESKGLRLGAGQDERQDMHVGSIHSCRGAFRECFAVIFSLLAVRLRTPKAGGRRPIASTPAFLNNLINYRTVWQARGDGLEGQYTFKREHLILVSGCYNYAG